MGKILKIDKDIENETKGNFDIILEKKKRNFRNGV